MTDQHTFLSGLATMLAALLVFAIMTDAAQGRWALTIFQSGVMGLGLAFFVRIAAWPIALNSSALLIPVGGPIMIGLTQIALRETVYPLRTWESILGWGTNLLVFFLALQVCRAPDLERILRNRLLLFGFAVSAVAAVQYHTSAGKVLWLFQTQSHESIMGPFVNYDHYATFIVLLLPLAIFRALADETRTAVFAVCSAIMFASVVESTSRAGVILVTLETGALLLPPVFRKKARLAAWRGALKVLLLAAVLCCVVGIEATWIRFKDPDPYRVRRELLYSSLSMIQMKPVMGFGLNTWPIVYPEYAVFDIGRFANHAHNDWAEWTADGGLPLLTMMLCVFFFALWNGIRIPWGLGAAAALLHCVVDFPMQKPAISALFFALLGMLAAASKNLTSSADADGAHSGSIYLCKPAQVRSSRMLVGSPFLRG
jgi:O-antigen ligase